MVNELASKSKDFREAIEALRASKVHYDLDIGNDVDAGPGGGRVYPPNDKGVILIRVNPMKLLDWEYRTKGENWYPLDKQSVLANEVGHALAVEQKGWNWDTFNGWFATQFQNKVMRAIDPTHPERHEGRHHDFRRREW